MARGSRSGKRTLGSAKTATAAKKSQVAQRAAKAEAPSAPKRSGKLQSALSRGLEALTSGVSERMAASGGVGFRVGKALLMATET